MADNSTFQWCWIFAISRW